MKKRLFSIMLILALAVPLAASIILPRQAFAGPDDPAPPSNQSIKTAEFSWYDRNTIHAKIAGKTYYFRPHKVTVHGFVNYDYLAYDLRNSSCWGRLSFDDHYPFHVLGSSNHNGTRDAHSFAPNETAPKSINVDMDYRSANVGGSSGNATCQNTRPDNQIKNVAISNPNQGFQTYFYVADGGRTLKAVDGSRTYTIDKRYSGKNYALYYRDGESTCQDEIMVDIQNGKYKSYELDKDGDGGKLGSGWHADPDCKVTGHAGLVKMGVWQWLGSSQILKNTPIGDIPGDTSDEGGDGTSTIGCDLGDGKIFGFIPNPLNWALCGILNGLNAIVSELGQNIINSLAIGTGNHGDTTDNPNYIFADRGGCGTDAQVCNGYKTAWSSFRNIALGLLVVVGLIIVISQALGMEILDAYTIRKMLPRLLIAVVAITLSWQLMRFMVIVSNDLGYGIGHLMSSPFSRLAHDTNTDFNFGGADIIAGLLVGLFGGAALGAFGLMSFLGTAAIAVLITFLVLTLRQIAVILLIVLSPLAILAYVLPNTQRAYKLWWESFSKLLLMFPLIVIFLTAGYIFAIVTLVQGDDIWHTITAFIAYFGPYFAVPLTFRFAGGMMGTIGNAVNSRGQPARDWLTKKRQENTARRVQRARAGKLWREGWGSFGGRLGTDKKGRPRSVSRYANRAMMWGTDLDEMVPGTIGAKGGRAGRALFGNYAARAQDLIGQETMAHVTKAAQAATANGPLHHRAERALAGTWGTPGEGGFSRGLQGALAGAGFEDGRAPETARDMQRMAQVMREYGDTDEISAAGDLENMAGFMGNVNKDPEMYRAGGNVQSVGAMMLASSGRLGPQEQAQVLERVRRASPHGDSLAARLEKQTSQIGSRARTEVRHGKGVYQDASGAYHSAFDISSPEAFDKAKDNLLTAKMPELMSSKGETVKEYAPVWDAVIRGGQAKSSEEQEAARAQLFQLASQYSSTDPSAKSEALKVIDRIGLRRDFDAREMRYDPNRTDRPGGPQPPDQPPAAGGMPGLGAPEL